jgi:hypothetical protein
VEANAANASYVHTFEYEVLNHFNILFEGQPLATPERPPKDFMEDWVTSYQKQLPNDKRDDYTPQASYKTSLTDADATWLRLKGHLGYHTHYVVDGGRNRVILGVLVTPANIQDHDPMLDFIRWLRFRWGVAVAIAVGDSKYGTIDNIVGLFREGILPFTPRAEFQANTPFYPQDAFQYDPQRDVYLCPQGQIMTRQGQYKANRSYVYRAKAAVCKACPVRSACTTSKRGRTIHRSFFQKDLDRAAQLRQTEAYRKAMRKRQVWVEPMFAEAKQWHGLRRFRLRRLWRVSIEALMIASVQNIKRLLKPRKKPKGGPNPAMSAALKVRDEGEWFLTSAYAGGRMAPQDAIDLTTISITILWKGKSQNQVYKKT